MAEGQTTWHIRFKMDIITDILIILFASTLLGEIAHRLGTERVVGQLISGIIIGPAVLNIIQINSQITAIEDISIFFIVLLIGIEVTTDLFTKNIRHALLLSLSSFGIPMLIILLFSYMILHLSIISSLAIALSVSVPSISIISVLVMQNNLTNERDGQIILLTVVLVDLFSFILIGSIGGTVSYTAFVLLVVFLIMLLIFIADKLLIHYKISLDSVLFKNIKKVDELAMSVIILFALVISSLFNNLNISFILGAFFAGILIRKEFLGNEIFNSLTTSLRILNNTFFIPIFFSIAGSIKSIPGFFGIIIVFTIISIDLLSSLYLDHLVLKKVIIPNNIWKTTGIMGGRGAVGIVIATYSLSRGFIDQYTYSIIILATITISVIASSLIRMRSSTNVKEIPSP